eukprot:2693341-Rhodomonas_salina.2
MRLAQKLQSYYQRIEHNYVGELNFRTTEKKHKLFIWDCTLSSFHAHHKADVQKMVLSYKMTYVLAAGQALFTKFSEIREEARKVGTLFEDNPDNWTDYAQTKALGEYFNKEENGSITTRIAIVRTMRQHSTHLKRR